MKIYFCLVGIFAALVLVHCQNIEEEMAKSGRECAKEVGLPEDLSKIPTKDMEDPKLKCMGACIMKKMGVMVDGKIVIEKILEFDEKYLPKKPDDKDKTDLTECAAKANEAENECEVAGTLSKCLLEKTQT